MVCLCEEVVRDQLCAAGVAGEVVYPEVLTSFSIPTKPKTRDVDFFTKVLLRRTVLSPRNTDPKPKAIDLGAYASLVKNF